MFDAISNEIINLKWLIITFMVVCLAIYIVFSILINDFYWNEKKVRFFSFFYGFNTRECICLGLMLCRCIYVIYFSISNDDFGVEYLITLAIMSIALSLFELDFINILTNLFTSFTTYVIIYLQSSLRYFYTYVEHDITILLMIIFLIIFTILFSVYTLISSYNHLITLDKSNVKKLESLKSTNKIKWPKIKLSGKLKSLS